MSTQRLKMMTGFAMVLVLLFSWIMPSSVHAADTTTAVKRMVFSIPANTFCDQSHLVELSLNVTNLGMNEQKVKLDFLKADGTAFQTAGTTYNGMTSELVPGSSVAVAAGHASTYHFTFGGQTNNCGDRPFTGIFTTSGSSNAELIASGFVNSSLYSVPIIVNGGMEWLSAPQSSTTEPTTPTPTPTPINQPIDQCSIKPVNSLIHAMTTNQDVYGKASSSSYDTFWDTQAYRAFDNSCSPFSTKNGEVKGWLSYEFNDAKTVTSYSMQMKQNDSQYGFAQSPNSWIFEAYDGKAWVTLDSQTGIKSWTIDKANVYNISNTVSYKQYRIRFLENNGGNLVCISELGMMGY
ncbi:hypothetical protein [Paenibacillus kandeliae]|uniref:hypothetical protein n=1 Tax=Paenibacillus kandeliae TaxID=3231269 RepID=UPI0034594303